MGRPRKNPVSGYVPKKVLSVDGATDILGQADPVWEAILKKLSRFARTYGFSEINVPFLEDSHLYENFFKGFAYNPEKMVTVTAPGKVLVLRSSLLPSVLRCYYQYKIFEQHSLSKWWFFGSAVKRDSKENLEFNQEFGFEVLGNFNHLTEAQAIAAVWDFLTSLGINELTLEINSLGKPECQAAYQETLHDFLSGKKLQLCDDCAGLLVGGRVLNVFRCGNLDCQAILSEAPTILDFLDEESHKHFTSILEALDELGIPYQLNHLYAGSEGHSKTNFVVKCKLKDKNIVIGEGGYHDSLMQNLCGKNYCCFGFLGSLHNLKQILDSLKIEIQKESRHDVFLVPLGELASKKSLKLFRDLIADKVSVHDHFASVGVKNQLKAAETFKAPIALIMGQKEAAEEMVILRDVKSGMQEVISYDKIVAEVKKRLGR